MVIYHSHYNPATDIGVADSISIVCPIGNQGKKVTLQVRGKTHSWTAYDNGYHNVVFWIKSGVEYPDQKFMFIEGDALDTNNQYDFVRLFIDNTLTEMYYISDF